MDTPPDFLSSTSIADGFTDISVPKLGLPTTLESDVHHGNQVEQTSALVGNLESFITSRMTHELHQPLRHVNYRSEEQIVSALSAVRKNLEERKYLEVLQVIESFINSPRSDYLETITVIQGIVSNFCLLEVSEEVTLATVRGAAWESNQLLEFTKMVARRNMAEDRFHPRSSSRVERHRATKGKLSKEDQDRFNEYISRATQQVRDEARGDAVHSLLLGLGDVLQAFEDDREEERVFTSSENRIGSSRVQTPVQSLVDHMHVPNRKDEKKMKIWFGLGA